MGARKRLRAEKIKEANKSIAFAKLNKSPIAPRKMRLVADLVRGVEVNKALNILQQKMEQFVNIASNVKLTWFLGTFVANHKYIHS